MKSKILFSTLVMAAAFSACTQEDIAVNNENASMEVVGAKLLASGISVNSGEATSSRVAVENGIPTFTEGDKAAVAWTVKNGQSVAYNQKDVTISELSDILFANHMLVHNGENFESRGNVYEGWHFAYRPFQYMAKPAQLKVVVNDSTPLVESDLNIDWYLNGPMFSNALFLSDKNVDVENGVVEADMPLYFVHNTIRPELNVDKKFTDDELLKKIAIKGITLNAGKGNNLFVESFKVSPKGLQNIAAKDAEGNILNDSIDETYYASAFVAEEVDSMVITSIENAEVYNLGKAKNTVRMFLAPTKDATSVKLSHLSFRIDVAGGHFDVVYTDPKDADGNDVELTPIQIANNKAINKMFLLLKGTKDDELNKKARDLKKLWVEENGVKVQTPAQTISMSLGLENFTADYLIKDSTDWNGCVALADALCKEGEVPTFTIASTGNVIFEDAISVPKNGVNVVGSGAYTEKITIKGEVEWPTNIHNLGNGINIVVDTLAELSVSEGLWASRIINKGTIKAGATSKIGENGRFNNKDGRVVIEYGAYVYPTTDQEGIIAYNVPANETAARINTLINGGSDTSVAANVNTLIIENGVVLDLTTIAGGTTAADRYNKEETADDTKYPTLDKVNVELNKGTIKSTAVVNVKNLTLAGESNTVNNINVLGELTIEAGTNTIVTESVVGDVTVKGGETTINGAAFGADVTIEAGTVTMNNVKIAVDLTNKGTVTISGKSTQIDNIVNEGELVSNVDVYVTNIDNKIGTIRVTQPQTMWYFGDYAQGGTSQGNILAAKSNIWDGTSTKEPELVEGVYQVNEAAELAWFSGQTYGGLGARYDLKIKLNADLNMAGYEFKGITIDSDTNTNTSTVEFDGNKKTITGLNLISENGQKVGLFASVKTSLTVKDLTFAKSEVNAIKYCGILVGYHCNANVNISNVVVNDCDLIAESKVGAFIGLNTEEKAVTINNSRVEGCTITATEKHGGIFIGCYTKPAVLTVNGNKSVNNTLTVNNALSTSLYTQY